MPTHHEITEDDLIQLFSYRKKKANRVNFFFELLFKIVVLTFFLCAVYITINFPAFSTKFGFWYHNDFETPVATESIQIAVPTIPDMPEETHLVPEMADNSIKIEAITVDAPITFGVTNTPKEVSSGLENGVIQINGTSLPGEKGNVYITGHSSNFIWAKGAYNSIFAVLDRLVAGDLIYIRYNGVTYEYKAYDKKVILPTDTSVLQQTNDSRLTLVTCWPVGTSLKRLVVLANQTYPDPKLNKPAGAGLDTKTLPSGR